MSIPRPLFGTSSRGSSQLSRAQAIKVRTLKAQYPPVSDKPANPATKALPIPVGRRGAARLRLSLPATLVSLYATHRCILIDLSCTGAQVGLEAPLESNETAVLQIAGVELFCEVVRTAHGDKGGVNGLLFDPPLEDQDVLDMRAFAENYQEDDLHALKSEVRDWVQGII